MQNNFNYKNYIYKEHLKTIADKPFTQREIDVMACLIRNRSVQNIASILFISSRTVGAHIYNVRMKLNYIPKNSILNFIEKSGKLKKLNEYYVCLLKEQLLKQYLTRLANITDPISINVIKNQENLDQDQQNIFDIFIDYLKQIYNCNITASYFADEEINLSINPDDAEHQEDTIFLFLKEKEEKDSNNKIIDFSVDSNHYVEFFKLLRKITNNNDRINLIKSFQVEYQKLEQSFDETGNATLEKVKKNSLKHSSWHIYLQYIIIFAFILYSTTRTYKKFLEPIEPNKPTLNKLINVYTPKYWNIGNKLNNYIVRSEITENIWTNLLNQSKSNLLCIYGLAGVGKTSLVQHIIQNPKKEYDFRVVFNAESESILKNSYYEFGTKYKLFTKDITAAEKMQSVVKWLESNKKLMVVFDNVPNMSFLSKYMPQKGDILITSRTNCNVGKSIKLESMNNNESIKLVKTHIKNNSNYSDESIEKLAELLGYFPLALTQAASFINANDISIEDYLKLHQNKNNKSLDNPINKSVTNHLPAYVAWDINLEQILRTTNNSKEITRLLDILSYCYNKNVPKKLLAHYLYNNTQKHDLEKLEKVLESLKKYSLIDSNTDGVTVHKLVQSWMQTKNIRKKDKVIKRIIRSIYAAYPFKHKNNQDIPFIRSIILQSKYLFDDFDKKDSEEYIDLLSIIGSAYYTLGDFKKSLNFHEKSLLINNLYHNPDSIKTAKILNYLTKTLLYLGEYKKAENLLQRSLLLHLKYYGINHTDTAYTMHHLGWANLRAGNHNNALVNLETSYAVQKSFYPEYSDRIASIFHNLGKVYAATGKHKKAKIILEKVLDIRNFLHGNDLFKSARSLHHLGRVYGFLGNFKLGLEIAQKAFNIRQSYYGKNHLQTSHSMHHVGASYIASNKFEKAKKMLESAIKIKENFYKKDHIETIRTLKHLGRVNIYLGNNKLAEKQLEKALKHYSSYYAEYNFDIINLWHYIGRNYIALKQYDKAIEFLEKSYNFGQIKLDQYKLDSNHMFIMKISASLGNAHLGKGNYKQAKVYIQKSIDIATQLYGKKSIDAIKAKGNMANLYRAQGNYKDAEKMLLDIKNILESDFKDEDMALAKINANIGLCYNQSGNKQKAKYYLNTAGNIFNKHLGSDNFCTKTINELIKNSSSLDANFIKTGYYLIIRP